RSAAVIALVAISNGCGVPVLMITTVGATALQADESIPARPIAREQTIRTQPVRASECIPGLDAEREPVLWNAVLPVLVADGIGVGLIEDVVQADGDSEVLERRPVRQIHVEDVRRLEAPSGRRTARPHEQQLGACIES